jgi:hypothetical protein
LHALGKQVAADCKCVLAQNDFPQGNSTSHFGKGSFRKEIRRRILAKGASARKCDSCTPCGILFGANAIWNLLYRFSALRITFVIAGFSVKTWRHRREAGCGYAIL